MSPSHQSIVDRTPQLGEDEAAFFCELYDRVLKLGHVNYGEWLALGEVRDMGREAKEELLDATVYLAMDMVLRLRRKRNRVRRFAEAINDNVPSFDDAPTGEFITPTIATRNATPDQCAECRTEPGEFHASECGWSQVLPASGEGV